MSLESISPSEAFAEPQGTPQTSSPATAPSMEPQGTSGAPEGGSALQSAQQTNAQPAQPAITPEMIQQAVQLGVQNARINVQIPQNQQQGPRQLSPQEQAEFDRTFNVVRMTPERFKAIYGFEPQSKEQLQAAEALLHDTVRQSIAMSQFQTQQMLQQMQQQFNQQLTPLQQAYQQQVHQQMENDFLAKNPDLKDHAALVRDVAMAAQVERQQGRLQFKSVDEAYKFVADRARSLLGKVAPTGQSPSSQRSGPQSRRMTPTSMGGSPGTGRPPQSGNSTTISPKDVFGDMG